ncbi:hypothetical protein [Yersinia kristensenii]|uniref:hypothetical protein n=1 Tax=Yersinia kristensenii TaxID=28152 RepID=UPI0011A96DD8|nr:hypothetical protein [Yersinia kristensenii]
MKENELSILCHKIRFLMESWAADGTLNKVLGSSNKDFPSGSCGTTSEALAAIIYYATGEIVTHVTGVCKPSNKYYGKLGANSHLWVEYAGNTIDLTGDQFNSSLNIPAVLISQSPHPLSRYMTISKKQALIVEITKQAGPFDSNLVSLINLLRKELKV